MTGLVILFAFALGAIIGSFLNVVSFRHNTGRSIGGRSGCMSCGVRLSWHELIPIFSFLAQRGRCRSCSAKISRQYLVVEIITGLVFVVVFLKTIGFGGLSGIEYGVYGMAHYTLYPILYTLYYLVAFSLLIVITVYDLRHKIIPNDLVWAFILISFAKVFLFNLSNLSNLVTSSAFLAGPLLALPFAAIFYLSGGRAMGFGDAKLALGLGWMLGLAQGLSMLLLSFWIGGAVGVALLLQNRGKYTLKSEIPFAPFLVVATFLEFIFQFDFIGLSGWLS